MKYQPSFESDHNTLYQSIRVKQKNVFNSYIHVISDAFKERTCLRLNNLQEDCHSELLVALIDCCNCYHFKHFAKRTTTRKFQIEFYFLSRSSLSFLSSAIEAIAVVIELTRLVSFQTSCTDE